MKVGASLSGITEQRNCLSALRLRKVPSMGSQSGRLLFHQMATSCALETEIV
jgi:hypothetical protein